LGGLASPPAAPSSDSFATQTIRNILLLLLLLLIAASVLAPGILTGVSM